MPPARSSARSASARSRSPPPATGHQLTDLLAAGIDPAAPNFWIQASEAEVETVMAAAAISDYLAPGYLAAVEAAAGTASTRASLAQARATAATSASSADEVASAAAAALSLAT